MPYDPSQPVDHSDLDAQVVRNQFNGLKDLIDAGLLTGVVVDAVNTLGPGQPATVSADLTGGVLHLSFSIPAGNDGAQGPQGSSGTDGQQGQPGQTGQPGEVSNAALASAIGWDEQQQQRCAHTGNPFHQRPADARGPGTAAGQGERTAPGAAKTVAADGRRLAL